MRHLVLCAAVAVLLIALPAAALPDRALHYTFFDESGNEIGTYDAFCFSGYYLDGQTSGIYTLEIYEACTELAPVSCQDFGEGELPNCTGINWCVSSSYGWSFYEGLVPNCQNQYFHAKQRVGGARRSIVRRASQSLPGRNIVPPSEIWRSRPKSGAPAGKFLEAGPSFSLQRWHTYLGGLRD